VSEYLYAWMEWLTAVFVACVIVWIALCLLASLFK
jgi:hypothetical protein